MCFKCLSTRHGRYLQLSLVTLGFFITIFMYYCVIVINKYHLGGEMSFRWDSSILKSLVCMVDGEGVLGTTLGGVFLYSG